MQYFAGRYDDLSLVRSVLRVEVRRRMFAEVHRDHDAAERRDPGHGVNVPRGYDRPGVGAEGRTTADIYAAKPCRSLARSWPRDPARPRPPADERHLARPHQRRGVHLGLGREDSRPARLLRRRLDDPPLPVARHPRLRPRHGRLAGPAPRHRWAPRHAECSQSSREPWARAPHLRGHPDPGSQHPLCTAMRRVRCWRLEPRARASGARDGHRRPGRHGPHRPPPSSRPGGRSRRSCLAEDLPRRGLGPRAKCRGTARPRPQIRA